MPALFSMLPDLYGKKVLDLGCGFGEYCKKYIAKCAAKVTGIDISEKILAIAREENRSSQITYINMAIEDIAQINGPFDVIISSLALHYIENFTEVVKNIYKLLCYDSIFIFS